MAFTTVRSATGVDFIGTPGVDVGIFFDESGLVRADGLGDNDVITLNNSTGVQRTTTLNGGDGDDTINVNTSMSESSVNGNKGRDFITLIGSTANSFIGGGDGADQIFGGNQILASLILGGNGADLITTANTLALATLNGGDGNDTIDLVIGGGQVFNGSSINGNAGADVIDGAGLNVTLSGVNFIGGGAGDDTINFAGATTDNFAATSSKGFELAGGSGADRITGSTENDTLKGGADNDTITGGAGVDAIFGGAGNDSITTSNGDIITGGDGADTYTWLPGSGSSTFLIAGISNSAAATTGTVITFDSFEPYLGFSPDDELNITAVTNQLAGGLYGGGTAAAQLNLGFVATTSNDFGALKVALDAPTVNGFTLVGSTTAVIQSYTFSANIGGTVRSFLWVQDSQRAYTGSDLLFETDTVFSIPGAQIVVA